MIKPQDDVDSERVASLLEDIAEKLQNISVAHDQKNRQLEQAVERLRSGR